MYTIHATGCCRWLDSHICILSPCSCRQLLSLYISIWSICAKLKFSIIGPPSQLQLNVHSFFINATPLISLIVLARFPKNIIDCKRAIIWAKKNAQVTKFSNCFVVYIYQLFMYSCFMYRCILPVISVHLLIGVWKELGGDAGCVVIGGESGTLAIFILEVKFLFNRKDKIPK